MWKPTLYWSLSAALLTGQASAEAPSVQVSGNTYTVNVPYLEYQAGGVKSAYSASFSGSQTSSLRLDIASVRKLSVDTAASATTTPSLTQTAGKFQLALPYLEYVSGTSRVAFGLTLSSSDLAIFSLDAASLTIVSTEALAGPSAVTVTASEPQTVGGNSFAASTKLAVAWSAPTYPVDHYLITATEALKNTSVTSTSKTTSSTLTDLKAATSYSVQVKACKDSVCGAFGSASPVAAATSAEYWQLQGTGNTYPTMTHTVSDGSVLSWVMHWGSEAGSALAGRYQLYYKTITVGRTGIGIANTTGSSGDIATLTSFKTDTSLGLRAPCTTPTNSDCPSGASALVIAAVQAVPLKASQKVRMFFEAASVKESNSLPTRIYSLDAQDGLKGQDFNSSATLSACGGAGSTDYGVGGACEFTPVIGLKGDSKLPSPLTQARQFKIGYPTLDSWLWDEAVGSFMVVTGDDACGKYLDALYYATYDGKNWSVLTDSAGCAKPLQSAGHGPVLVHLGAARYKLYYEDSVNGRSSNKPLRMRYADGASSGSASVDFDDWEAQSNAREVNFLWPDGSLLDISDESGLGDHMILTGDTLATQTMFLNLGGFDNPKWLKGSSGLGIAKLLNP